MNLQVLLLLAVCSSGAGASPSPFPGFLSIPISRPPPVNRGLTLPPTIVHQQHANRGIKRLEHMKGRDKPLDHDLLSNIQQRASVLSPSLNRRYYQPNLDVPSHHAKSHRDIFQTSSAIGEAENEVTKANSPTFHSSVGLDIEDNDVGYIGTVQIGTPPRDFRLLMDSGSADFWVGAEMSGSGKHTSLGPNSSSSLHDMNKTWTTQYGTGAVSGHLITDHLVIAGLLLESFTFGIASSESKDFLFVPFDGLAGLARSTISRQGTITLVEALHKNRLIPEPIVSYKIPRLRDGKHDGEMTLGAMNPAKFDPKTVVTLPNVDTVGFWEAEIDDVKLNGKKMGWRKRTAVFDTGTTLIIAPRDDVDALHKAVPGAVFDGVAWTIPCLTTTSLSLVFRGREFSIQPSDLAFTPLDPDDPDGDCTSGMSPGGVDRDTEWLLGDVFLKNVYMSTNTRTNRISLAKLAD